MLMIIFGKAGSGKSTLAKFLDENSRFDKVVTTTTREMREGEVDGIDYHFISQDEFMEKIDNDEFLEYGYFCKGWYGTQKCDIDLTEDQVIVLEPNGLRSVVDKIGKENCLVIFLNCAKEVRYIREIERGDDILDIALRQERDKVTFQPQVIVDYTDLCLNTTDSIDWELYSEILDYMIENKM